MRSLAQVLGVSEYDGIYVFFITAIFSICLMIVLIVGFNQLTEMSMARNGCSQEIIIQTNNTGHEYSELGWVCNGNNQ